MSLLSYCKINHIIIPFFIVLRNKGNLFGSVFLLFFYKNKNVGVMSRQPVHLNRLQNAEDVVPYKYSSAKLYFAFLIIPIGVH